MGKAFLLVTGLFLALAGAIAGSGFLVFLGLLLLLIVFAASGQRMTRRSDLPGYQRPKAITREWSERLSEHASMGGSFRALDAADEEAARQAMIDRLPVPPTLRHSGPCVVTLTSAGSKKINVIKVLRDLTRLGLKEAKEITDSPPAAVLYGVSQQEAEHAMRVLEAEGATVVVTEIVADQTGTPEPITADSTPALRPTELDEHPGPFRAMLLSAGPHKIEVIKALRELTGSGLKEAVDLTELLPSVIRQGISGEEADRIREILQPLGAMVEVDVPKPVAQAPVAPRPAISPEPRPNPPAGPPSAKTPLPVRRARSSSTFDVVLLSIGAGKDVAVRKALKKLAGLDLLDAYNASVNMPAVVKTGMPRAEAEKLVADLRAEGAGVQVRASESEPSV